MNVDGFILNYSNKSCSRRFNYIQSLHSLSQAKHVIHVGVRATCG